MGKYDPLRRYLADRPDDHVRLTFTEVQNLVGALPESAYKNLAWWANNDRRQSAAWQAAGWRVDSVDQSSQEVVFGRAARSGAPSDSAGESGKRRSSWGRKRSRFLDLGPGWISAIGTLLAAVIAGIALILSNSGGHSTSNSNGSANSPATGSLAPATVSPSVHLCSHQLLIGADGNASPLTCSNGDLNELAWEYYAKASLNVMALGPDVVPSQVLSAMCSDVSSGESTSLVEMSAYDISALYYGWHFGISPSQEFQDGDCNS